jgi:hypothetical protein
MDDEIPPPVMEEVLAASLGALEDEPVEAAGFGSEMAVGGRDADAAP